jgi:N-acetylmuramoyl-L-alanine amidase
MGLNYKAFGHNKNMRRIDFITIHCSATPQTATVASIQRYWREVLKWKSPGYHAIIAADGTVTRLAPDEAICNGVAGFGLPARWERQSTFG